MTCPVCSQEPHALNCPNKTYDAAEALSAAQLPPPPEFRPEIVDLLRRFGSTLADYLNPRAGAWCNFCNKPFTTELDVIKTSTGVAICRTCVEIGRAHV